MNLVFIGDKFYRQSGTIMSPVYQVVNGVLYRSDWGKINIALSEGQEVHIRPANEQELNWANNKLIEILTNDMAA